LWAHAFGEADYAASCAREADQVASSFDRVFWNASRGALYDVIGPEGAPDPRIRPNQIFAVALPFPLLDAGRQRSIVGVVEHELLTPYGLRTLSRDDPAYVAHYGGGPAERDGAYHQGTVWPWLMAPFIRAYLTVHGRTAETIARCRELLRPLETHLADGLLGSISEVFDAEPPFRPGGCPAQAWSVAELLRLVAVDLAESPRDRIRRGAASPEPARAGR
ncbi:MAG TPA: amylo-alpha-1,6-glucosidase, partial [Myxococcales bacterium]|nr:amylo-alpha-1,6-glucosidase [Myxococcales bacterium]